MRRALSSSSACPVRESPRLGACLPSGWALTTDGEAAFRVMETAAVADALTHEAVVSLGGGAAVTPAVRELLSGHTVVYIDAPHEELVRRTASKTHRPLLAQDPSGTLARLRAEREPHYRAVATIVVESGPGPVDDVVTAIAQQLEDS